MCQELSLLLLSSEKGGEPGVWVLAWCGVLVSERAGRVGLVRALRRWGKQIEEVLAVCRAIHWDGVALPMQGARHLDI